MKKSNHNPETATSKSTVAISSEKVDMGSRRRENFELGVLKELEAVTKKLRILEKYRKGKDNIRSLEDIEKQKAWVLEHLKKPYNQLTEDQVAIVNNMDRDVRIRLHWEAYLEALRWVTKDRHRSTT